MKDFKKLKIWQKGMEIVKMVYLVAAELPAEERFGLRYQICKSAVSIPSNIAEGSAKSSNKDYKKFLEVSLGSAFELETQLLAIEMLRLIESDLNELMETLNQEQKMLGSFMKKIMTDD